MLFFSDFHRILLYSIFLFPFPSSNFSFFWMYEKYEVAFPNLTWFLTHLDIVLLLLLLSLLWLITLFNLFSFFVFSPPPFLWLTLIWRDFYLIGCFLDLVNPEVEPTLTGPTWFYNVGSSTRLWPLTLKMSPKCKRGSPTDFDHYTMDVPTT